MSLRARLLIAIGAIAIVALVGANVVTYSELQSFLTQRIDQQLEQSHIGIEASINSGQVLSCFAIPGQGGRGTNPTGGSGNNQNLSLIHISEPTRQAEISYAVFCLKKK